MTAPFTYPSSPHVRRHGPAGYSQAESFRPWLRDEFSFRCVYCLTRETWGPFRGLFAVDHFLPVALRPDLALEYDNLLFACTTCNAIKNDRVVPDPTLVLLADKVAVDEGGILVTASPDAARLIELLDLNEPHWVEFRYLWMATVNLARRFDPAHFKRILGYPADLPVLDTFHPPKGNTRPGGIADAHYLRRERGDLPETY